jgi:hypothetical protein
MAEWTPDARWDLDEFLRRVADLCRAQGDDADDVTAGLREHILAELNEDADLLVTRDRLAGVLSRLGTPEQIAGADEATPSGSEPPPLGTRERPPRQPAPPRRRIAQRLKSFRSSRLAAGCSITLFLIFAILIPLAAIAVEALSGTLAELYLDPIPTFGHIVLLALVPLSLAFAASVLNRAEHRPSAAWYDLARAATAFALVVSGVYAIVFLPFAPFALLGVLALGLGLLPLAPYFTLTAAIRNLVRLTRIRGQFPAPRRYPLAAMLAGCLIAVLAFVGLHGPQLLSIYGTHLALSDDPDDQVDGVRMLRRLGGAEQILDACYSGRSNRLELLKLAELAAGDHSVAEYRRLFFRVTGRPFNSLRRSGRDTWDESVIADQEIGGQSVAGVVPGLRLFASTMDVNVESGPAIAYVEWTTVFRNKTARQQEARAQVVLPHDSVGSRLTLWIDGEEREAAFGSRLQVREAYQEVAVRQRRDPALLTTMGPGRVLLQCFPVPAGGQMRVKVGVTVPLIIRENKAWLRLPHYAERNFSIPRQFQHEVWASGNAEMAGPFRCSPQEKGGFLAKGTLGDLQLLSPEAGSFAVEIPGLGKGSTFEATLGRATARMQFTSKPEPTAKAVCVVVDGSRLMGTVDVDWARICTQLPIRSRIAAVFAGDRVEVWREKAARPTAAQSDAMTAWIESREYAGGRDCVPALEKAWDLVAAAGGGAVLWIHGPMPVQLSATDGLRQRLTRQSGIELLAVQAVPGPNRIEEALKKLPGYERIDSVGSLAETVTYAATSLRVEDATRTYALALSGGQLDKSPGESRPACDQLVRLAVNDRIGRLLQSNDMADKRKAVELAVSTRLVTPVSGAVVLERKEQYERHGLDPNAPIDPSDGTPGPNAGPGQPGDGVPEPGGLAVILGGLLGLKLLRRRRRI